MFTFVQSIEQFSHELDSKKEIISRSVDNNLTVLSYIASDATTFNSMESLECRGIMFDSSGKVVSRPLHKFFNVNEREDTALDIVKTKDIVGIYPKLDGSMICTADICGSVKLRSKNSFSAKEVELAYDVYNNDKPLQVFCQWLIDNGFTGTFELTHPDNQIVIQYREAKLSLLHIRDNITGEYILLDLNHPVHDIIDELAIDKVEKLSLTLQDALVALPTLERMEGFIVQFSDGDMVKLKTPWYLNLHRKTNSVTEKELATYYIQEELDDMKSTFISLGVSADKIKDIEHRAMTLLLDIEASVTDCLVKYSDSVERKVFVESVKADSQYCELFQLIMQQYSGKVPDYKRYFLTSILPKHFTSVNLATAVMV